MNKKGFTLIETILVILLMSIILLIIIPNIFVVYNKGKIKECNNLKKNIISAAKIYVSEYKYELNYIPKEPSISFPNIYCANIRISDLLKNGILKNNKDGNLINPFDNKEIDIDIPIQVEYNKNNGTFDYYVNIKCGD